MFRKSLLILTLLSLTLLFAGCIEIQMETELKKDGSGTGEMKLTISPKVTEIMARYEGISDMPETDITHMANLDEDELKAVASKAHVKIKNFKSEVRDGRKTVSFKMEFKTLEDYSWVLGYVMDDTGGGFGVFAGEEGQLIFKEAMYDFSALEADQPVEEELTNPSEETMEKYLEMMDVIKGDMAELKFVQVVKVPGKVLETDATETKGRTCTWTLDFATMLSDKDSMLPRIVFSSKGVKIKPMADQEF
jgi:hypothetical protein